jgi:hypothetical protein
MQKFDRISAYLELLQNEEEYDEEVGYWYFRSGGSCLVCTDSALKVALKFKGCVFGYEYSKNPTAQIGPPHCNGHDFAMVSDSIIVDFWAYRMGLISKPIMDLNNGSDQIMIRRCYGNPESWEQVPELHLSDSSEL